MSSDEMKLTNEDEISDEKRQPLPRICRNILVLLFNNLDLIFGFIVFFGGLFGPLIVMQVMKEFGLYGAYILTVFQILFVLSVVSFCVLCWVMEQEIKFISSAAFFLMFIPILFIMFADLWALFNVGTIGKAIWPEHSIIFTAFQLLVIVSIGGLMLDPGEEYEMQEAPRRYRDAGYSKTVMWFVFYK